MGPEEYIESFTKDALDTKFHNYLNRSDSDESLDETDYHNE